MSEKIKTMFSLEEVLWIVRMSLQFDKNGYEIESISKNKNGDPEINLKPIVLSESRE